MAIKTTKAAKNIIYNPNSSIAQVALAYKFLAETDKKFSFKTDDIGSKEVPYASEKAIYEAYIEYREYTYYEEY